METNSILKSIKKLLGIPEEYNHFDTDIIIHINSIFMALQQIGVGPRDGFQISDDSATWDDFISEKDQNFEAVKTYIYIKTKLVFDPPQSSIVLDSLRQMASEYEWRLNIQAENSEFENKEVRENVSDDAQSFAVRFRRSFPNKP